MIADLIEKWGLTEQEGCEILGCSQEQYQAIKEGRGDEVGDEIRERVSDVYRINKGLRLLFKDPKRGEAWIKKPNKAFEGRSAFEVMKSDLVRVRKYLEAELW